MTPSAPDLPLLAKGKVREIYDLGDDLLMVASDRISTYDVVHPTPIPDKGQVLTGLSVAWFDLTRDIVPNHFVSATDGVPDDLRGRALRVRRLSMLPVECVVRGYLSGSGWKDYQRTGTVSGVALPEGLRESDQLPEPIYTPSTKADEGHDEAIDFEQTVELIGDRALAERVRDVSLGGLRRDRRPRARARGDPRRHEVRVRARRRRHAGRSATRSARRTPRASGRPTSTSRAAGSRRFDKQYVRDWAAGTGWDKTPPAPGDPRRRRRRRRASATCAPTSCWPASRSRPGSSRAA